VPGPRLDQTSRDGGGRESVLGDLPLSQQGLRLVLAELDLVAVEVGVPAVITASVRTVNEFFSLAFSLAFSVA
jgi:hypothetical protein